MKIKFTISLIVLFAILAFMPGCRKSWTETIILEEESDVNPNATPYNLIIPPFFPPMDIPENNPLTEEGVELGRYLFWDPLLSGDNTQSCGDCHLPEYSFSDPNQFSVGITGAVGDRQAMALLNLGWAPDFFWDGRSKSLEEQVVEPVANPIEMNQDWDELLEEIAATELYPPMFEAAFGTTTITKQRCAKAMASFLRTMISSGSNYDKSTVGQYTFTESEQRGFDLFVTEGAEPLFGADCFHCHGFGAMQFADYLPHNNGLDSIFTDLGVGGVTGNPAEYGKFKTPTIRNAELTAPYMHDGRFQTLEEVIDHYDSGGHPSATIDPFMKYTEGGLQLTDQDKEDLIAFIKCLTDTAFTANPAFSNPHGE